MKNLLLAASMVVLAASCFATSAIGTKSKPKVIETDVCSVLKTPEAFVNHVIRLRGYVYLGVDHMNVSSIKCPGQGIELAVKTEAAMDHKDIHHFYVQVTRQGRRGIATITGLFEADKDPLTLYVLNIEHVKDVAPRP